MKESVSDLNQRIAGRVRDLRLARSLSLDALAGKSGVSRSMISLIERGESSPTAVVLEKLAAGLNVALASLFDAPASGHASTDPVVRRRDQPQWKDPASGYIRRNVSPARSGGDGGEEAEGGMAQPMRIIEVHFPAGGRVAFEPVARDVRVHQQIWVLKGTMYITLGEQRHRLGEGDCLAMLLDGPTMFHNPTRKPARYAVVIACEPALRKR